ncbi:hypothetical protein ACFOWE_31060 [Planomonospora corallina]|uniref:Uncharacterized protein n=1 Tax=Planomonospora corallina TaxID=1806052 RepID=A0ABV8II27_9ACTN
MDTGELTRIPLAEWWRLGAVVAVANVAVWMAAGAAWFKILGAW